MNVNLNQREIQMLMESIDLMVLEINESIEQYDGSIEEMLKESLEGYLRLKGKLINAT